MKPVTKAQQKVVDKIKELVKNISKDDASFLLVSILREFNDKTFIINTNTINKNMSIHWYNGGHNIFELMGVLEKVQQDLFHSSIDTIESNKGV